MIKDINFCTTDTTAIRDSIIEIYQAISGRSLGLADPIRLFLYSVADIIVQQRVIINNGLKQNLLYYATGDNLDHLGYLVDTDRLEASKAVTTLKITLSAPINKNVIIPAGTRVSTSDNYVFATDRDIVITPGNTEGFVDATAAEAGEKYNDYVTGMICRIIDPIAYVDSIVNITKSEGGADEESDEAYRNRIHEAPESFSNAGSSGAYRYYAMTANPLIADVSVTSPSPGEVLIQPLLSSGELPDEEILQEVKNVLTDSKVRPLTDKVIVKAPDIKKYNLDLTYYISRSDSVNASEICTQIEQAINDYVSWQKGKLGRDINPTEIYYRIRDAGAKYADIRSPAGRIIVADNEMAVAETISVAYGGLEDD
jgi:phage-related baseplate assembly protein